MNSHDSTADPIEIRCTLPISAVELSARVDVALCAAMEKVVRESVANEQVLSLQEAVALTPWTEAGFKRVATKENLPFIKGPHKSPPAYRRGDVVAMLQRMRVWPKGRPAEVVEFPRSNAA